MSALYFSISRDQASSFPERDRKSTRLNSSHGYISYAVFCLKKKKTIDDFAPRLSLILNTQNDLLEAIAKYRAARRLWSQLMLDRFGVLDPSSMIFFFNVPPTTKIYTLSLPDALPI